MTSRLRLLVVDGDPVDRLAMRRAIEQADLGAEVDEVGDVAAAIAHVRERTYDCLLVEEQPAGELTQQLRASGNLVPIVLVTGRQNEELLQQAVDAGITDFILKADLSPRRIALRVRFA